MNRALYEGRLWCICRMTGHANSVVLEQEESFLSSQRQRHVANLRQLEEYNLDRTFQRYNKHLKRILAKIDTEVQEWKLCAKSGTVPGLKGTMDRHGFKHSALPQIHTTVAGNPTLTTSYQQAQKQSFTTKSWCKPLPHIYSFHARSCVRGEVLQEGSQEMIKGRAIEGENNSEGLVTHGQQVLKRRKRIRASGRHTSHRSKSEDQVISQAHKAHKNVPKKFPANPISSSVPANDVSFEQNRPKHFRHTSVCRLAGFHKGDVAQNSSLHRLPPIRQTMECSQ